MRNSKKGIKKSITRSGRTYPIITKDISIKFDDFTEIVECYNIGDCINDSKQLSLKKLLKKLEKNCNYFFKSTSIF